MREERKKTEEIFINIHKLKCSRKLFFCIHIIVDGTGCDLSAAFLFCLNFQVERYEQKKNSKIYELIFCVEHNENKQKKK